MTEKQDIQTKGDDKKPLSIDELLMAYTEGNLSAELQRHVEELLSEEGPDADAIEGLLQLHPAESKRAVAELHRKLYTEILATKNKRTNKFKDDFWGWIAVVIILLLVVVAYVVVRIASK